MGQLARSQVSQAKDALRTRNVELAQDLVRQDAEINRLNREIFRRAVEIGDDPELREWGMFMILVARCLERVGDNTVDIAEQVVFVVTGLFRRWPTSAPPPTERRRTTHASGRSRGWSARASSCPRGPMTVLGARRHPCAHERRPPQIVAFGGGGFSMEWGNPLLDDHVLSLTGVQRPRVCFLPTASGDADHYVVRFYRAFPASRCEPSHISLFRRETGRRRRLAHLRPRT